MIVRLVAGPPCAGKSRYVEERQQPGDVVWDQDKVLQVIAGQHGHELGTQYVALAMALRNALLDAVQRMQMDHKFDDCTAWVVACAPTEGERRDLMQGIHYEEIVLETELDVCLARLRQQGRPQSALDAAADWWQRYERTW